LDRRGNNNSATDDNALPAGLAERARSLKGVFHDQDDNYGSRDENRDDLGNKGSSLGDLFGFGSSRAEKLDHVDFHKNRMEDYRQSLGLEALPVSPLEANNPFAAMRAAAKAAPAPPPHLALPEGAHAIDFNAGGTFGTINPLSGRSAFQDTTVRGYGSSSLAPALPRTEPPKPAPAPSFSITKRPF
jgi:hypothetical protein